MDWKEAAKWVGILVAAGLVGTAIEMILEWKVFGPATMTAARSEARNEVDRIMTAALKQSQAHQVPFVAPQKDQSPSLVFHV